MVINFKRGVPTMSKLAYVIFAVLMVFSLTGLILVFSNISCNSDVQSLKFNIYDAREEVMQLKDSINDLEQYVPKEKYSELMREYENADNAVSELLLEYLKLSGD